MLGTGSVMSDYILVTVILPRRPGDEDDAISRVVNKTGKISPLHVRLSVCSQQPDAVGNGGNKRVPNAIGIHHDVIRRSIQGHRHEFPLCEETDGSCLTWLLPCGFIYKNLS